MPAIFSFLYRFFTNQRTIVAFCIVLVSACSPVSKTALTKKMKTLEANLHEHAGFMLYDPAQKKELFSYQANQYFTPASNTKIFTLYTALTVLGDSIPGLQYAIQGDSLIFKGTGDPSFLYENVFHSDRIFQFLATANQKLFFSGHNFFTNSLGPGWAWDDYYFAFSSERSAFPIYGNYFLINQRAQTLRVQPPLLSYQVSIGDSTQKSTVVRDIGSNKITYYPGKSLQSRERWKVPFKTSNELTASLLSDTLKKNVTVFQGPLPTEWETVYSIPSDTLFKVMMEDSDNFIAEQLLLMCAQALSDSLRPEVAIRYMKKKYLSDLPDEPIWVDGSGLSRYNLFTPRSIVGLWEKIHQTVPQERLFQLLAVGGKSGTLKNYFKNDTPYIYGKTGTLSNNHSLSGYLVTKKGRTLIFCFNNNNYPKSKAEAVVEMDKILKEIYLHY